MSLIVLLLLYFFLICCYNGVMNYVEVVIEYFWQLCISFAPVIIPLIVIMIVYKMIGRAFR